MRGIAVQPPHLGGEAIGLLARIVAGQDHGLAQDDIEPYLLVRLLRCGYVRRQTPHAGVFVATPAGIERSRIETIAEQRRQDVLDRREIVRGRLRAMAARLDLDYPAAPPAMTLRDFQLPKIYQRPLPVLLEPLLPVVRLDGGRRPARDHREAAVRDVGPRATLDDALALISESARRATSEGEPPVTICGNVVPQDGDLPVVQVGQFPPGREDRPQPGEAATAGPHASGGSAGHEAAPVAACETCAPGAGREERTGSPGDHPPVWRAGNASPQRDDLLRAWLLAGLIDAPAGPDVPDADQPPCDAMPEALGREGSGWMRASVVAAVAAVALLAGDPLCQSLSRSADVPAPRPNLRAAVHATRDMDVAEQPVSRAAAGSADLPAPVVRVVADRIVPAVTLTATPPVIVAASAPLRPPLPASDSMVTEHDAAARPRAIGVVPREDVHLTDPPASPAPLPAAENPDAAGQAGIVAAATVPVSAVAAAPIAAVHAAVEARPVLTERATMAVQQAVPASASSQPVSPTLVADAVRVETPVPAASMAPHAEPASPQLLPAPLAVAPATVTAPTRSGPAPALSAAVSTLAGAAPTLPAAVPTLSAAAPTRPAAAPGPESRPAVVAGRGIASQSEPAGGATPLPVAVATSDTTTPTVQAAPPEPVGGGVGAAWEAVTIQNGAIQNAGVAIIDNRQQRNMPSVRPDAEVVPQEDTASRVLERLRNGSLSDDAEVERLNTLSLRAAQAGRTFAPRVPAPGVRAAQRSAAPPGTAAMRSLP